MHWILKKFYLELGPRMLTLSIMLTFACGSSPLVSLGLGMGVFRVAR